MLPKRNRIRKKREFDAIFKNSKSLKINFLNFKIAKNESEEPKFGFVVSKKVSPKATTRNKIRRAIATAVANHMKNSPKNTKNIIIIATPQANQRNSKEIIEFTEKCLKQL